MRVNVFSVAQPMAPAFKKWAWHPSRLSLVGRTSNVLWAAPLSGSINLNLVLAAVALRVALSGARLVSINRPSKASQSLFAAAAADGGGRVLRTDDAAAQSVRLRELTRRGLLRRRRREKGRAVALVRRVLRQQTVHLRVQLPPTHVAVLREFCLRQPRLRHAEARLRHSLQSNWKKCC